MPLLLQLLSLLLLVPLQAEEPLPSPPEPPVGPQAVARYRLLHAVPRRGPLTIYVDGAEAAGSLAYGDLTAYEPMPAGEIGFSAGDAEGWVVTEQVAALVAGHDYTVALVGDADQPRFVLICDRQPVLQGDDTGRARATNLVEGRIFTFAIDDRPLAALLRTGQSTPAIAAGFGDRVYRLTDTAPGGQAFSIGPATVPARSTYSLYVIGLPGAEDEAAPLVVEDLQDWPADEAPPPVPEPSAAQPRVTRLRVLHLAGGSGALGGQLDGKPLFSNLAFGDLTAYLPQAPGTHHLVLAGGPQLDREPLELRPDEAHTLVLCGEPDRLRWWLLYDDDQLQRPALRIVHTAWQAPPRWSLSWAASRWPKRWLTSTRRPTCRSVSWSWASASSWPSGRRGSRRSSRRRECCYRRTVPTHCSWPTAARRNRGPCA